MIQCWHIIQRYHIMGLNHNLIQIYCSILLPWNVVTTIWSWDWNTLAPCCGVVPYEMMTLFIELPYQESRYGKHQLSCWWNYPPRLPKQPISPVKLQNGILYTIEIEEMHEGVFQPEDEAFFTNKERRVTVLWSLFSIKFCCYTMASLTVESRNWIDKFIWQQKTKFICQKTWGICIPTCFSPICSGRINIMKVIQKGPFGVKYIIF